MIEGSRTKGADSVIKLNRSFHEAFSGIFNEFSPQASEKYQFMPLYTPDPEITYEQPPSRRWFEGWREINFAHV